MCLRFCRDIDGDNQRPLLFPEGFFIALSPVLWASGFLSLFIFLVMVLLLVHLDAKWPLIRHCIESKNPREDQYRINHSFDVGLSGYLVDQ